MDLASDSIIDNRRQNARSASQSLGRSILTGTIGFALTSLVVFGIVAFAQVWMYQHIGVTVTYLVWIALFILLGGRALSPLVAGSRSLLSFYKLFGAAFFLY